MKSKPQGGNKQVKNKNGKLNLQNGLINNAGNKNQKEKNVLNNNKKKRKENVLEITSPNQNNSPKKNEGIAEKVLAATPVKNKKEGKKNKKQKLNESIAEIENKNEDCENETTPVVNPGNIKKQTKKKNRRKKSKKQENTSTASVTVEEDNDSDAELAKAEEDASESEAETSEYQMLSESMVESEVSQGEVDLGDDEETTIFVGNLPNTVNKKEITNFFKSYGKIKNIRLRSAAPSDQRIPKKVAVITKDFHASANSINAFVTFTERFEARNALASNGSLFNGHHIRVNFAKGSKEHNLKVAIFVGNLPFGVRDDELWETFESCGEIESVRVIRDRLTRMGKGFGYVNFKSSDAVELALQMEDVTLQNRKLRIARASTPKAGQATNKKARKRSLNTSEVSENNSPQKKRKGKHGNQINGNSEEVKVQSNAESKSKKFQGQKSAERRQKKQTFKKKMKKVKNEKQKKSIANFLNSKPGKEIIKNKS